MKKWGLAVGFAAAAVLLWPVWQCLGTQLFWAYLLMGAALPLCRWMERRLSPSLAATGAFAAMTVLALGFLTLVVPALVRQFEQLGEALPALTASLTHAFTQVEARLAERGMDVAPLREAALQQVQQAGTSLLPRAAQQLRGAASQMGSIMLAPLLAFYLLRDRRRISASLTLLVPVRYRRAAVLAAREMRRETAGFLRGQLLLSGLVGLLTGLGLLAVGTPGWLVLGLLMGVMELIPYIGPLLAGIPAVLLALTGGWTKALWTLAVLVGVQQLEGGFLSPRMLSGATKLSPLTVLLSISAGGVLGGTLGMLLALPVVVSVRGACRAWRSAKKTL